MRGKVAKKIRRLAPLVVLDLYQRAEEANKENPDSVDFTAIPTVRQVYQHLKHNYTRGR